METPMIRAMKPVSNMIVAQNKTAPTLLGLRCLIRPSR